MKILLFVIMTVLLVSPSVAQNLTDSVGTANTFWQTVTLLRGTANVLCEVINDSSSTNYMLVAKVSQDTVAGRTRYVSRLNNYESIMFNTNQAKVFVKVSAGTATYRVKTY